MIDLNHDLIDQQYITISEKFGDDQIIIKLKLLEVLNVVMVFYKFLLI